MNEQIVKDFEELLSLYKRWGNLNGEELNRLVYLETQYANRQICLGEIKAKGIDALDRIIDLASEPNGYQNFRNACDGPYYRIVKAELLDYEELKKDYAMLKEEYSLYIDSSAKEHRVIKIIKEKKVDLALLELCEDYEEYNSHGFDRDRCLDCIEFMLVKRILL